MMIIYFSECTIFLIFYAEYRRRLSLRGLTLRACETLWNAREIASVVLSTEHQRHTENLFHMLLN